LGNHFSECFHLLKKVINWIKSLVNIEKMTSFWYNDKNMKYVQ
jgi:hypothetical protein